MNYYYYFFVSVKLIIFFNSFTIYSSESQEVMDAELAARVLQLIKITDSGLHAQVMVNWLYTWRHIAELIICLNLC
jgi:hypothetical protein